MVCKYRDALENGDEFDEMNPLYFERQPVLGIPIPGEPSFIDSVPPPECLIYIYDQPMQPHPSLKLHDMIEVIGILENFVPEELFPSPEETCQTQDSLPADNPRKKQRTDTPMPPSHQKSVHFELSLEEEELLSMVSSYQPNHNSSSSSSLSHSPHPSSRIHCLFYHHISPSYPFYSSICDPNHLSLKQSLVANASDATTSQAQQITQLFSSILHDSLVSQYLTLAIISSVYNRIESSQAVGNLPLNIWNANSIPPPALQELLSCIKMIAPRVIEVELISFLSFTLYVLFLPSLFSFILICLCSSSCHVPCPRSRSSSCCCPALDHFGSQCFREYSLWFTKG
jgi:hypothetical protein